jgi:hypothetical protein
VDADEIEHLGVIPGVEGVVPASDHRHVPWGGGGRVKRPERACSDGVGKG